MVYLIKSVGEDLRINLFHIARKFFNPSNFYGNTLNHSKNFMDNELPPKRTPRDFKFTPLTTVNLHCQILNATTINIYYDTNTLKQDIF